MKKKFIKKNNIKKKKQYIKEIKKNFYILGNLLYPTFH